MYTNHEFVFEIVKQIFLSTSSIIKLNLRLIRVSKYIQQFKNLEFRHKPEKKHIISNVFSRFPNSVIVIIEIKFF